MVLLNVDRDDLAARLARRHGHFFPAALLNSQLGELELPDPAEPCLVVRATRYPAAVVDEIVRSLGRTSPQPGQVLPPPHQPAAGLGGASGPLSNGPGRCGSDQPGVLEQFASRPARARRRQRAEKLSPPPTLCP